METSMLDPEYLFSPKSVHGENARDFVGRLDLIEKALDAVSIDGGSAIIYGPRGIGKTSLAWQVASTLEDSNPRFNRKELATVGLTKRFTFSFIKCPAYVKSLDDLLLAILLPSSDEYSISKRFEDVYQSEEVQSKLKRKYEFNLATLAKVSLEVEDSERPSSKHLESAIEHADKPALVRAAFSEMAAAIRQSTGKEILFVVDEADRLSEIDGLGHFLKDNDLGHFLFVGIAENISKIIRDHASAGRKLVGGDISVPEFSDLETRQLFYDASLKSERKVRFEEGFLDLVVKHAYGYPWIAKQVGFAAVQMGVRRNREILESGGQLVIGPPYFEPAMSSVVEVYCKTKKEDFILDEIIDSDTKETFLNQLWTHPDGMSEADLRAAMGRTGKFVPNIASGFLDVGLLTRGPDDRLRFEDPITRILVRFYIDDREQSGRK